MQVDTEEQLALIQKHRAIIETPLWKRFIGGLQERIETLTNALVRGELTQQQVWEHRGRVQELETLVKLPETLLKKEEYLQKELRREHKPNAGRQS